MQQAPIMKSSGLAPINDEPVHVFGRNLEERVIESKQEEEGPDDEHEDENKKRGQDDDLESIKKRKFDAMTGEEDEETAFQGEFKLFIWDKSSSNWTEKGRGQLKLNDSLDSRQHRSRLIMRAGGTYRIILNVAIQHSFFKVIGSTKTSIRFTDSLNVWAASGSNAKQLGDLIEDRLSTAHKQAATFSNAHEDDEVKKDTEPTGDEAKSDSSVSEDISSADKKNEPISEEKNNESSCEENDNESTCEKDNELSSEEKGESSTEEKNNKSSCKEENDEPSKEHEDTEPTQAQKEPADVTG